MAEFMPTLLFLSGASLVGQNVLTALAGRRTGLHLAALNSEAREPALYDFDSAWLAPEGRRDPAGHRARYLEVYGATRPALVIPCRDEDILFLARLARDIPEQAPHLLCGSEETAAAMLDKWQSWVFSRDHGLPFVPTESCAAGREALLAFAGAQGYPLIAKPREGFASRGVSLLLNQAQLEGVVGQPGYIVQKYLGEGEAVMAYARHVATHGVPLFHSFEAVKLSIQALVGPAGDCLGVWATHNTMKQGRSEFVAAVTDAGVLELGRQWADIFARAGWRGPLNIQCQVTPAGETWIYEYNGRFTGATGARALLGYDEVGLVLRAFAGIELPPGGEAGVTREVKRTLVSRPLPEDRIDTLGRDGVWHAR